MKELLICDTSICVEQQEDRHLESACLQFMLRVIGITKDCLYISISEGGLPMEKAPIVLIVVELVEILHAVLDLTRKAGQD